MTSFNTKLGTNKGAAKSRVWIEGKRLIAAGFTVGARYRRCEHKAFLRLVIEADPQPPESFWKVSGKGEKPIIDITGQIITSRFKNDIVTVAYGAGIIEIHDLRNLAVGHVSVFCLEHPEWGTFGVKHDHGLYYDIGGRVLSKDEAVKFWGIHTPWCKESPTIPPQIP